MSPKRAVSGYEQCTPQSENGLVIARITWVEVLSALARMQREATLNPFDVAKVVQAFRYDLDIQYQVVDLDQDLADKAGQLIQQHPLRAYDAVQLAAALKLHPAFAVTQPQVYTFVSSDNRLLTAAQQAGLQTANPNNQQ